MIDGAYVQAALPAPLYRLRYKTFGQSSLICEL